MAGENVFGLLQPGKDIMGHERDAGIAQPADVAAFVLTVMEGAVMQSRAFGSIEPFDACVRQLKLHFAALQKPPRLKSPRRRR